MGRISPLRAHGRTTEISLRSSDFAWQCLRSRYVSTSSRGHRTPGVAGASVGRAAQAVDVVLEALLRHRAVCRPQLPEDIRERRVELRGTSISAPALSDVLSVPCGAADLACGPTLADREGAREEERKREGE
eukprot:COSAG01_NODE_11977_length_1824_cov_1.681159_3_plen_131_part_01